MRRRWLWLLLGFLLLATAGGETEARPDELTLPDPHIGYGINVRDPGNLTSLVDPLGLDWIKLWEEYDDGWWPVERLPYQVLYLLDCRAYVFGSPDDWGDHVAQVATEGLGRVEAYEICNEPNVYNNWNGQPPDPAHFTEMLCIAHDRIKAIDPDATVVSAGLAPVGRIQGTCDGWSGNNCGAMDEREYARAMLAHGAGDCMDAFGYHPYGFAYEAERDPHTVENGFAFRGAEIMHEILLENGLSYTPIWATEFNWLRDWEEDGGMHNLDCLSWYESMFAWMEVTGQTQADYLTAAFEYADAEWPWMHGMFVWNLDWQDYHTWDCEAARYFSLRRNDGSDLGEPAPAYGALAALDKRPGPFAPRLLAPAEPLVVLADVDAPGWYTVTASVENVGYRTLSWTATVDPRSEITLTLPVSAGEEGDSLWVSVDTAGLVTGTYTGSITVTAIASDVLDSPGLVAVDVRVLSELWHTFLPAVTR
jgi:hypothetical protein